MNNYTLAFQLISMVSLVSMTAKVIRGKDELCSESKAHLMLWVVGLLLIAIINHAAFIRIMPIYTFIVILIVYSSQKRHKKKKKGNGTVAPNETK